MYVTLKFTRKTVISQDRTNRVSQTNDLDLDLDLDLQSPAIYDYNLFTRKSSWSTVSFEGRVETNGRTDERRRLHYLPR